MICIKILPQICHKRQKYLKLQYIKNTAYKTVDDRDITNSVRSEESGSL